jgi:hypothetical protein
MPTPTRIEAYFYCEVASVNSSVLGASVVV